MKSLPNEARAGQRLRKFSAAAAVIMGLAGLSAAGPAQADTTVQSLNGESLVQTGPGLPNGVPVTMYDCNPSGTSTVTFTATGVATGPYPGTFTETGTVVFGPQAPFGTVTSFQAEFTITSVNGTVTGTKTLQTDAATAVAFCNHIGGQIIADLDYTAQITTPSGTATDQGQSYTTQFNVCPDTSTCGTIGSGNVFTDDFESETFTPGPPPQPVAPTTAGQCKSGGYKNYPSLGFKNQGDCVSFVATQGKNRPAGS